MSGEIIEVNNFKNELSLTGGDIDRVVSHLEQVKNAVSKVMKEGIDNDYAVIPHTHKKSLLKPGAEKLMRLFGLGARFKSIEKTFDLVENFAMYSYEAEVYHLRTGTVIASCEGTANSQEKKYKERKIYTWQHGKKIPTGSEAIPVADIVNTLKKMAQKRAMVGAVIIAVGASDYFSQDEDEINNQAPVHKEADKVDSSRFNNEKSNLSEFLITFGQFNDHKLGEIDKKRLTDYVNYLTSNNKNPNGKMKEFIDKAREYLR